MDIYFLNQPNCKVRTHHFFSGEREEDHLLSVLMQKTVVAITLPSSDHLISKSTRETM